MSLLFSKLVKKASIFSKKVQTKYLDKYREIVFWHRENHTTLRIMEEMTPEFRAKLDDCAPGMTGKIVAEHLMAAGRARIAGREYDFPFLLNFPRWRFK